jgi:hypothetical protein
VRGDKNTPHLFYTGKIVNNYVFLILIDMTCLKKPKGSQMWWYTPIISAFGRMRQEYWELDASLGYIRRPCFQNKTKT